MSAGRVMFEAGTRHVLAYCPGCPPWRELEGTRAAAYLKAAAHVERVHGDAEAAAEYRRRARVTRA